MAGRRNALTARSAFITILVIAATNAQLYPSFQVPYNQNLRPNLGPWRPMVAPAPPQMPLPMMPEPAQPMFVPAGIQQNPASAGMMYPLQERQFYSSQGVTELDEGEDQEVTNFDVPKTCPKFCPPPPPPCPPGCPPPPPPCPRKCPPPCPPEEPDCFCPAPCYPCCRPRPCFPGCEPCCKPRPPCPPPGCPPARMLPLPPPTKSKQKSSKPKQQPESPCKAGGAYPPAAMSLFGMKSGDFRSGAAMMHNAYEKFKEIIGMVPDPECDMNADAINTTPNFLLDAMDYAQ